MEQTLRILLLADTHLGFDEPEHPRVERRRRGPDFLANFEKALLPAQRGEVDAVVHGGDVFYRSRIPPELVERAFRPLARIGAMGVPVFVVPGNHERSRIPFPLLAVHKNVHIFDRPRTFTVPLRGQAVAFSGFPYAGDVRARFTGLVAETAPPQGALRFLCIHQAVEGARVGTPEFTFTSADDVVRGRDLPAGFAAVLSGHIHRGQRLTRGLDGRPFAAPVYYPGSIERTSFAERHETKGYLVLHVQGGRVARHDWCPLQTRPMVALHARRDNLRARLAELPPDAIVRVQLHDGHELTAAELRDLAPPTMTVEAGVEKSVPR